MNHRTSSASEEAPLTMPEKQLLVQRAHRKANLAKFAIERRVLLIEGLLEIPASAADPGDAELVRGLLDDLVFAAEVLNPEPLRQPQVPGTVAA